MGKSRLCHAERPLLGWRKAAIIIAFHKENDSQTISAAPKLPKQFGPRGRKTDNATESACSVCFLRYIGVTLRFSRYFTESSPTVLLPPLLTQRSSHRRQNEYIYI